MPLTAAQKMTRASLQQDAARAALTGVGPRCDTTRQIGNREWACVMPPHASGQPSVDNCRRNAGQSVHADRHVFTATP